MSVKDGPSRDPVAPGAKEDGLIEEREGAPLVPGFSRWKSVYWFVLVFFVLCIVLMRALQEFFS